MKVKNLIITTTAVSLISFLTSCTEREINFDKVHLELVNREIIPTDEKEANTLALNAKEGGGMAVIKNINFDMGTIALELKGENNPGKSFIGIAFNIQNDSTYEAVYFRPFNFRSDRPASREHSIQYISPPHHTWQSLRTKHEGEYEAAYLNPPSPDEWFGIRMKIDSSSVSVYDKSGTELLNINRLEKQASNKIALWTGNNSKGVFKNMRILK
ncbi:hypothetical protein [Sinomicrobium weinanense]|uniref:DUF1080 domain-containing protein n=1 Tax=Sinomicrobium weinanense TaxID=2842200 RepID=A0A926Q3F8_9FLAO|nr:hypothetical protein [Sinomicrobium weinanense]MBC9795715.1 hypothetical protein [Sinomicrobium weinanense]MBU3125278.1 hypothetical protein [Sinomicrobium weinanense]